MGQSQASALYNVLLQSLEIPWKNPLCFRYIIRYSQGVYTPVAPTPLDFLHHRLKTTRNLSTNLPALRPLHKFREYHRPLHEFHVLERSSNSDIEPHLHCSISPLPNVQAFKLLPRLCL